MDVERSQGRVVDAHLADCFQIEPEIVGQDRAHHVGMGYEQERTDAFRGAGPGSFDRLHRANLHLPERFAAGRTRFQRVAVEIPPYDFIRQVVPKPSLPLSDSDLSEPSVSRHRFP